MNNLSKYIIEKLHINKDMKLNNYKYYPENFWELRKLLEKLLQERGPDADLNNIDTSKVTEFCDGTGNNSTGLFENLDPRNIDISEWNTSKVTTMEFAFIRCKRFNCDLSSWDLSSVKNMNSMFNGCEKFEGKGLKNWKTGKVRLMYYMFKECFIFNEDISSWDVSSLQDSDSMFRDCTSFNYDLNKWDVKNLQTSKNMFKNCDSLKNIPSWYNE